MIQQKQSLRAGLALSKTPLEGSTEKPETEELALDTAGLDRILGYEGKASGGVYHFAIPRAEEVRQGGMTIPPSMGTATAINFQPTGDGKAAVTGDLVMTADEVNRVIRALREHDIKLEALHNHMLFEQPRLFFMHFWADADAQTVARGLRAALAQMNVAKS